MAKLQIFSEFCECLTKLIKKDANNKLGYDDRITLDKPDEDTDDNFLRLAHEGLYSKAKEADV